MQASCGSACDDHARPKAAPLSSLMCLLVLLVGVLAPGGSAEAARRPDLRITRPVRLWPDRAWATKEEEMGFTFRHTTANIGTEVAPRSKTGVEFKVSRHGTRVIPRSFVRVPRIPPDQTRSGHHDFSVHFGSWEYGTTRPSICADLPEVITELNEANTCWEMRPFYVVPRQLSGPVVGRLVQDTAEPRRQRLRLSARRRSFPSRPSPRST
jgi:hypothetical protein